MKITDVEVIPITIPLSSRYDNEAGRLRMYDIDQHEAVKVTTDNGIIGYGSQEEGRPVMDASQIEMVMDTSPFDFIQNHLNASLGMALYDIMGKYLEIPAYKLMGQKVRDAVPVGAWTRPCAPDIFAGEVKRAEDQGYRVFKMHSDPRYDIIEQTRAAQDVAPEGFKLHWDLNHSRTPGTIGPLIKQLETFPVVGFIEDPLPWTDIEGWRLLRAKTSLPTIMHVPQLGGMPEVIHGCADIYMTSGTIGRVLQEGTAYGRANVQVLIQQSGSTLMRALSLHQASVLPTATVHLITLDDQFDDDITVERIPVTGGFCRVPEAPGLGIEVDETKLKQAAERKSLERLEHIAIYHLPDGKRLYALDTSQKSVGASKGFSQMTGFEEGDLRGMRFEAWADDGSEGYDKVKTRLQSEGWYVGEEEA
jgi:L-alanine-DL-glutamate epimerase-like enolase superfamily enzyme